MISISKYITPEAKQAMTKKLKIAMSAYWILLFLMIFASSIQGDDLSKGALLFWFASAVWLSMAVVDAASSAGGSAFIWRCGTLLLGPIGAIVFPVVDVNYPGRRVASRENVTR